MPPGAQSWIQVQSASVVSQWGEWKLNVP
jgi:hypothetical protein